MKHSVVVIAHNEEKYIGRCIQSLLDQTVKPGEIIVVAHSCSDRTEEIAGHYAVKVISFDGLQGTAYARMRGIQEAGGDIILCIDGDCIAQKNWIEIMSETLQCKNNRLVGSYIKFKGGLYVTLATFYNKYACTKTNPEYWLWGGSFAFLSKDKNDVIKILEQGIALSEKLGLSRNPDDYWLAVMMKKIGSIEITNKTFVTHYPKELTTLAIWKRNRENNRNGRLLREYVKNTI